MSSPLPDSLLYRDLTEGARDAMYRAMSYVALRGGPPISGPADDLANLRAHRAGMLGWLQAQPDLATLVQEYLEYRERWSPVFKD